MRFSFLLAVCILSTSFVWAQGPKKSFQALRTTENIKIDGLSEEDVWSKAAVQSDFVQRRPDPGKPSERNSEVQLVYDDEAIYVFAKLYESEENVFNLLTNRDNIGNADYFGVTIDPFNAGLNGVGLFVTVSGVQNDALYSNGGNESIWRNDRNWNAVWLSETKVFEDYWTVEMKIPYAVLRFDSKDVQNWGINFMRQSTFLNEDSYWNPIDPEIDGFLNQSGQVKNLEGIETPPRLFFYPYVSTVLSRSTATGMASPQLNGGMDIKYGLSDAFTLDVTLIPDFSGVRSDNEVLNLSPFEVRFDENRQFFTEGVELFNKAGLFYSRRIGTVFGNVTEEIQGNESIISRPQAAQLINASKITGRTNTGLGIGFFNALTDRTFVKVEDSETGEVREVEADPLTNFNVLVLDQNLKNNSSVTFTNTNVTRGKNGDDSNVAGLNLSLNDPTLTWRFRGDLAYSSITSYGVGKINKTKKIGTRYNLEFGKNRGNFQFEVSRRHETDEFDINDLGFQRRANQIRHAARAEYIQFTPKGMFNNTRFRLRMEQSQLYAPKEFTDFSTNFSFNGTFTNFWRIGIDVGASPVGSEDFFEARTSGYVFSQPEGFSYGFSLNTDRRMPLSLSLRSRFSQRPEWNSKSNFMNIGGRLRVGERIELNHNLQLNTRLNERGYATRLYDESGHLQQVVMGVRDVRNVTNTLSSSYIFTNRMGLTFRMRHYWSRVDYSDFLELREDKSLVDIDYTGINEETGDIIHNRNFNQFNIDMEYNWQFLPGSEIRFIWKRSIGTINFDTATSFLNNFNDTMTAPNFDTFTLRMVYFIDYLSIKNIFKQT